MAISFHLRDGRSDFEKVARENCRRISHRLVELQIPLVSQQFNYFVCKKRFNHAKNSVLFFSHEYFLSSDFKVLRAKGQFYWGTHHRQASEL